MEAATLVDFIQAITTIRQDEGWLFRGHADESWPLIPALARITPVADTVRAAEQDMMAEFKRFAVPYLAREPQSEWDWLALAQHYGIPTRLLDWTANPLAALLFAVTGPSGADSVVWCFRYQRSQQYEDRDPYTIDEVYVVQPSHFSMRIVGQASYFTAHPLPSRPFDANAEAGEELLRIVVPSASRARLRSELDRVGVNYATLFPDLDGIARHITWSHTVLQDEHIPETSA